MKINHADNDKPIDDICERMTSKILAAVRMKMSQPEHKKVMERLARHDSGNDVSPSLEEEEHK